MGNMNSLISSRISDLNYWFFNNNQYFYFEDGIPAEFLPTIDSQYLCVLEKLGIPFRKIVTPQNSIFERYEYWSPDHYQEVDVTLPLYVRYLNGYRRLKNYTGKVISTETSDAAFQLAEDVVEPAILEYRKFHQKELQEMAKKAYLKSLASEVQLLTAGHPAIGIEFQTLKYRCSAHSLHYEDFQNITFEGSNFKVMPVYALLSKRRQTMYYQEDLSTLESDPMFRISTDFYAIFDMDKIPSGGVLDIAVPSGTQAVFIGRSGWQVKEWCKILGVKRINVIALQ